MQSSSRQPRKWTPTEDRTLRQEVEAQLQDGGDIKDWCKIAATLSGRTNKDCRKRWHNSVAGGLKKGQWSKSEDASLARAVQEFGPKWTVVATCVESRSADQCAKRWQQSLNPELDRSEWREAEDKVLIEATQRLGRHWKDIQQEHFPGRSKNCIKNRYTVLIRRYQNQGVLLPNGLSSPSEPSSPRELVHQLSEEEIPHSSAVAFDNNPSVRTSTSASHMQDYWYTTDSREYPTWSPEMLGIQVSPQLIGHTSASSSIPQLAYAPQSYGPAVPTTSSTQISWTISDSASPFGVSTHSPYAYNTMAYSFPTSSPYTITQSSSIQNIPTAIANPTYPRIPNTTTLSTHGSTLWSSQSSHGAVGSVSAYADPRRQRQEQQQHPCYQL